VSGLVGFCLLASVVAIAFKLVGFATPGWVTTVIGTSLVLMVGLAILSFIGLTLSILAGTHTIPTPATVFKAFILRVTKFGSSIPSQGGENSIPDRPGTCTP
jgi:hypothetical protein